MSNEIELTPEVKIASEWAQNSAPKGLILDQTENGELNGRILRRFLETNRLPLTIDSLIAAARMEGKRLFWAEGCAPGEAEAKAAAEAKAKADAVAARRKRDGIDTIGSGGRGRQDSHIDIAADQIARAKEAEAQRSAAAARAQAAKDAALKDQGRSSTPTALREIPSDRELTRAEMNEFTPQELAAYLKKQHQNRWQSRR